MKVRLGDYIEQIRGVSYSPADLHSALNEKSVILLRANNINDNKINFDDVVFVDKSKVSKKQYLQEGDILVCASSGSKHLVGKAAYMDKAQPVTFGAFCKIVRPKTSIKRYIGYFFESPFYRTRISELSGGANINNIKNEHIDNLEFELLEDRTQNDICSKLNKISFIIDKRKQQLEKLDLLVKSKFIEMFGNPILNEKKIPLDMLSNIAFLKAGKNITAQDLHDFSEETPYPCFGGNGIRGFVSKWSHDGNYCLIGRQGALCGNVQIVAGKFYATEHAVVVNLIGQDNVIWLYYCLKYLDLNRLQTGAAQPGLNIDILSRVMILRPVIEEQNQFAKVVEQTKKTKLTIKKSLDKLETLKKALMQKYFG